AGLRGRRRPRRPDPAGPHRDGRPRPARPARRRPILGAGLTELVEAGLVEVTDEQASAVSPYTAEVAAGLLDADERRALHRRLADLVPPRESARHLAAAGEPKLAYDRAVEAAAQATSLGERAELLALACELPGAQPDAAVRLRTAATALAV